MKQVGFKPGVKEREGVVDEQSGESEEEEVMGEGVIGESDMKELVMRRTDKVTSCYASAKVYSIGIGSLPPLALDSVCQGLVQLCWER